MPHVYRTCILFSDKTLIVWKLTRNDVNYGVPSKRLYGHSHFISDVVLSSDGNYALSGSWDKTLRLWDLGACKTARRFEDHTKVGKTFHSGKNSAYPRQKNLAFCTLRTVWILAPNNKFRAKCGKKWQVCFVAHAGQKRMTRYPKICTLDESSYNIL